MSTVVYYSSKSIVNRQIKIEVKMLTLLSKLPAVENFYSIVVHMCTNIRLIEFRSVNCADLGKTSSLYV